MTLLENSYHYADGDTDLQSFVDDSAQLQAVVFNQENSLALKPDNKLPNLDEIELRVNPDNGSLWSYYKHKGRACFKLSLMQEVHRVHTLIRDKFAHDESTDGNSIKWFIQGSRTQGVFSYGGDLSLFAHLIRTQNRAGLTEYAQMCVRLVHELSVGFNQPILTVALLQGDALGGGFENALACDFIVAERQSKIGLPETLFNLFPGMGAYSFLFRRVGHRVAKELICSGEIYTADKLFELGIVDVLAEKGEGEQAVSKFIHGNRKKHDFYLSMREVQRAVLPVTLSELTRVVNIWVDAAFRLTESDIRKMERIAYLQTKK